MIPPENVQNNFYVFPNVVISVFEKAMYHKKKSLTTDKS